MEENSKNLRKKAKGKTRRLVNSNRLKNKYEIFNSEINKWKSSKNLVNFVPRITPKKSYCKPSLFELNPNIFHKPHSEEGLQKNLIFEDDSDSFELSIEQSKDDDIKNLNDENSNKKESEEKLEISQNQDFNIENNMDSYSDKEICNKYDSGEYVTILDILSMNHNNNNL